MGKTTAMKTVLCHGCFDCLHFGHLMHLQEARSHGDILIVGVTSDRYVNKGPGRPIFNWQQRMAMLRALAIVDRVLPSDDPTPAKLITDLKPDVFCKGIEYKDKPLPEKELVEIYGGKVIFTYDEIGSPIHTSDLISHYTRMVGKAR